MNSNIISTPQGIIRALRRYYTDNNVTTFEHDDSTSFAFQGSFAGSGFLIQAAADEVMPRVTLLTTILSPAQPSLDECRLLANELNRRCHFVSVHVCPEEKHFHLESMLALGDGQCLLTQLHTLAEGHMGGVAKLGPMLGRYSRREATLEEIELELEMHAHHCEEIRRQGIPHRASNQNRWTPPLDRN